MSTEDTREKGSPDIGPRTRRAFERACSVLHTDATVINAGDEPSLVAVISGNSGHQHTVDVREERCTCEDHRYRGVECYHIRRAKIALGVRPVTPDELAAVDVADNLGANAPGPVVATSDGRLIQVDD
jgi:hypothetical protein